nr:conserved hypothetical protein [uncultured archaeon]
MNVILFSPAIRFVLFSHHFLITIVISISSDTKMNKRGIQYFTLSEIEPRVWLMLTGCNFRCKGCFRPARDVDGIQLTAEETIRRMGKACLSMARFPRRR